MKNLLLIVLLIGSVMSVGCSTKQLSREEQLAMQKRQEVAAIKNYEGFTKDEIIKAAEKVLWLMDPSSDTTIIHQEDRIVSYRQYRLFAIYMNVVGVDTYVVTVHKVNSHYEVSIAARANEVVGIVAIPPAAINPDIINIQNTTLPEADSKLFFERLDYFLQENNKWISCNDYENWSTQNGYITTVITPPPYTFICKKVGIEDKDPSYFNK